MIDVSTVLDRLYAINQTLTDINAARYYPRDLSGKAPLVIALPQGRATYDQAYGLPNIQMVRPYVLILYAGNFDAGVPTVSAQKAAERLMNDLPRLYFARPRLELAETNDAGVTVYKPLTGVSETSLQADDGLTYDQRSGMAVVRFTLQVKTEDTIERV